MSLRRKFEGAISLISASAVAPTLSFVVPAGQIFKGVISVCVFCSTTDVPTVAQLNKDGNAAMFFGPSPATASGVYHTKAVPVELPPGSYFSTWYSPSGSGANYFTVLGCLYRA